MPSSRSPQPFTETSAGSVEGGNNNRSPQSAALMEQAHDYGYSNTESLNSMGMLTKVRGTTFDQPRIDFI